MSVCKLQNAKVNLKAFRVRSYLNVVIPALTDLLSKTDFTKIENANKKDLTNHLVQIFITLSWTLHYAEASDCQTIMNSIRTLTGGDLTTFLSPYLISNYFLAQLRIKPIIS